MSAIQNTLIVLDDATIAANIKPALANDVREVSRVTGLPLSRILNRALDVWMDTEAPVHMNRADPKSYGWMQRPTFPKRRQKV